MIILFCNKKRSAALYVRVSTAEQANEGYSLSAQKDILEKYCELYGIDVYSVYSDAGISGKSLKNRESLQKMMNDAEAGLFDTVIVWKISRLSRSLKDLLIISDKLDSLDISLISYSENFDTKSPVGRMTLQILGSIAEFERNTIVENVKLGMQECAKSGKRTGGVVLGYDSTNKGLTVNQKEAECVKLLFDMYSKDEYSLKDLSDHVNKLGYRTKCNNYFTAESVGHILSNPVYIGKNRTARGVYSALHNPIVSDELFCSVQKIRAQRRNSVNINRKRGSFLLSGNIYCPACNGRLNGYYGGTRRYYRCTCGFGCVSADKIESTFTENFVMSNYDNIKILVSKDKKGLYVLHKGDTVYLALP